MRGPSELVSPEVKVSEMIQTAEEQLLLASQIMDKSIDDIGAIAWDLIDKQEKLDHIATSEMPLDVKCQRVRDIVKGVVNVILGAREANDKVIAELKTAREWVLVCRDHISKNAKLAHYDQLTWAGNRHKYYEDMNDMKEYLDTGNGFIAFAILDIDFFKSINDKWWHAIWDAVLKTFSMEIKKFINELETPEFDLQLYRWGWEEFVIVGRISITELNRILDEFRTKIAIKSYHWRTVNWRIQFTFSGWISGTNTSNQLEHLFPDADKKLYQSKHTGRNKITA